jgi:cytoskeletal protein CcmA (bactofilin family)
MSSLLKSNGFCRIGLALALLMAMCSSLSAYQYKKGTDVYVTGDYQEDLYLWGSTVNFDGTVVGDIISAARIVTINGTTDGSVTAAAQKVTVNGEICRTFRCFAQTVNITSKVDGDVVAFCADMTLGNDAVVGKDIAIFSGEVFLDGTVGGKAYISGATITIAGRIDGDVTIIGDKISIAPDAVIGGELNYTSKTKANIASDAQIAGDVKWKKKSKSSESSDNGSMTPSPTGWFWSLVFFVGSLLIGIIMILVHRERIVAITEEIRNNAAIDGLVGAAVIVVVPLLIVLIAITLVGIPIAVAGLAIYGILFLIAKVFVGITIGLVLLGTLKKTGRISLGWALVVGMILLAICFKIPVVGWIVYILAWAIGAGAMTMLLFRKKSTTSPAA